MAEKERLDKEKELKSSETNTEVTVEGTAADETIKEQQEAATLQAQLEVKEQQLLEQISQPEVEQGAANPDNEDVVETEEQKVDESTMNKPEDAVEEMSNKIQKEEVVAAVVQLDEQIQPKLIQQLFDVHHMLDLKLENDRMWSLMKQKLRG